MSMLVTPHGGLHTTNKKLEICFDKHTSLECEWVGCELSLGNRKQGMWEVGWR